MHRNAGVMLLLIMMLVVSACGYVENEAVKTTEGLELTQISENAVSECETQNPNDIELVNVKDEDAVSKNSISEDTVSVDSVSMNTVSADSISADSISEDSVSEDTVSEDSVSENEFVVNPTVTVNMILDMDFCSDIDDVCALRIATSLMTLGKVNLIATGNCVDGDYGCRGMHGLMGYDGYNDILVGMSRRGIELDSGYDVLVTKFCDYQTYQKCDVIDLYKRSISECSLNEDESLRKSRIVTTGFLVNIEDLLRDEEGYALVRDWVDSIWIVGGTYPVVDRDFNFYWTDDAIASIQYVNANSPVPIVYVTNSSGVNYETGQVIWCGWDLERLDPDMHDPLNAAFRDFEKIMGCDSKGGNAAWDGLAVWAAAMPWEEAQIRVDRTDVEITDNGTSIFYPNPEGRHGMLERNNPNVRWYSEELDKLLKINLGK